jgi:hypothetical protein
MSEWLAVAGGFTLLGLVLWVHLNPPQDNPEVWRIKKGFDDWEADDGR